MTEMRERLILAYAIVWTVSAAILLAIVLSPYNLWNPIWSGPNAEDMWPAKYHDMLAQTAIEAALLTALLVIPPGYYFLRIRPHLTRRLLRTAIWAWSALVALFVLVQIGIIYTVWQTPVAAGEYDRFRPAYTEPVAVEYMANVIGLLLQACVLLVPVVAYYLFGRYFKTNGRV